MGLRFGPGLHGGGPPNSRSPFRKPIFSAETASSGIAALLASRALPTRRDPRDDPLRRLTETSIFRPKKTARDEDVSEDGRFLYAIDADSGQIFGWSVGNGGALAAIGFWDGLPRTAAGLAAS